MMVGLLAQIHGLKLSETWPGPGQFLKDIKTSFTNEQYELMICFPYDFLYIP